MTMVVMHYDAGVSDCACGSDFFGYGTERFCPDASHTVEYALQIVKRHPDVPAEQVCYACFSAALLDLQGEVGRYIGADRLAASARSCPWSS